MSKIYLADAIEQYANALSELEDANSHPTAEQILAVLSARDVVHEALTEQTQGRSKNLVKLLPVDKRLRIKAPIIANFVGLDELRESVGPPADAWWWSLGPAVSATAKFDWPWGILSIVIFTISLSLLVDTSTRFLTGGPDTLATLAVVIQSVFAMLVAGGTLTNFGREILDRAMKSTNVSVRWMQWVRLTIAILLLVILLVLHLFLPKIAVLYNNRGLMSYFRGNYTSAEFDFQRALKLDPDYAIPHYNLGLLYEDLQDYDQAKAEYRIAAAGKLMTAYNNLARLYIKDEKYSDAVSLLLTGLDSARGQNVLYDMYKNLGWARLGQQRYTEAETELRIAINLIDDQASAHCLLAQVLDAKGDAAESLPEWEICLKYADGRNADEDNWISMARQRLSGNK